MGAYVSTAKAIEILKQDGDFTENQARCVLVHSIKKDINGAEYFPLAYITQRAKQNRAKADA